MLDLFGNRMYGGTPSLQMSMFDESDGQWTECTTPAIVRRENGETASGGVVGRDKNNILFRVDETGNVFVIPLRYCKIMEDGKITTISIRESELWKHCGLYGMFASCRLF